MLFITDFCIYKKKCVNREKVRTHYPSCNYNLCNARIKIALRIIESGRNQYIIIPLLNEIDDDF